MGLKIRAQWLVKKITLHDFPPAMKWRPDCDVNRHLWFGKWVTQTLQTFCEDSYSSSHLKSRTAMNRSPEICLESDRRTMKNSAAKYGK